MKNVQLIRPSRIEISRQFHAAAAVECVWPAAVIVATYWIVSCVPAWLDAATFVSFFAAVATSAALTLFFWTWWFTNRSIAVRDRLFAFVANVAGRLRGWTGAATTWSGRWAC